MTNMQPFRERALKLLAVVDSIGEGDIAAIEELDAVTTAGTAASLTVGGEDGFVFEAAEVGFAGNEISIALVDPGQANQAFAINVTGSAISIDLATDAESNVTTTYEAIVTALALDADATALGAATLVDSGATVAVAAAAANLTGGVDDNVITEVELEDVVEKINEIIGVLNAMIETLE